MSKNSANDGYARAVELTEEAMRISDETHYEEGERLLREAAELVPDEQTFTQNYVEFCVQVAHNNILNGDYDEAIAYYRKALRKFPDDAETLIDLGSAYAHNEQGPEALEAWQKALKLLNAARGKDKANIETILENVRTVQKALKEAGVE